MLEYSELTEAHPILYQIKSNIARLEDFDETNGLIIKDSSLYKSKYIDYESNNIEDILYKLKFYYDTSFQYERQILNNVIKKMTVEIYETIREPLISKNGRQIEDQFSSYIELKKITIRGLPDEKYTQKVEKIHKSLYDIYKREMNNFISKKHVYYIDNSNNNKKILNTNPYKDEIVFNEILPPAYTPQEITMYKDLSHSINSDTKLRIIKDVLVIDNRPLKCISRKFTGDNRWKILNHLKDKHQNEHVFNILQKLSEGVYKNDVKWKEIALNGTNNKIHEPESIKSPKLSEYSKKIVSDESDSH